jgi:hypothetical protein
MFLALRTPGFLPESITRVLFENHYVWWVAILLLGAVLVFAARSRGDRRMLRVGQIVLGVTLLWIVAAQLLVTPGERLYAAHLGMADAAAKADVNRILSYFEPNFSVEAGPVNIQPVMTTSAARELIAASLKQYGIKETVIRTYDATLYADGTAVSHFTALTLADQPLLTTWRVSWDDVAGQDWRIHIATLVKIGDQEIKPGDFMP